MRKIRYAIHRDNTVKPRRYFFIGVATAAMSSSLNL